MEIDLEAIGVLRYAAPQHTSLASLVVNVVDEFLEHLFHKLSQSIYLLDGLLFETSYFHCLLLTVLDLLNQFFRYICNAFRTLDHA